MTKLNAIESKVYAAIRSVENDYIAGIAFEADMSTEQVEQIVTSLVAQGVVEATDALNDEFTYNVTDAEVELTEVEAVEEVEAVQQEEDKEEVKSKRGRKPKEQVEELDLTKFTKSGKPRKVSNAALMREQIAQVKGKMEYKDAEAVLMAWAMETLGHTKQLAKSYVKSNWDRV